MPNTVSLPQAAWKNNVISVPESVSMVWKDMHLRFPLEIENRFCSPASVSSDLPEVPFEAPVQAPAARWGSAPRRRSPRPPPDRVETFRISNSHISTLSIGAKLSDPCQSPFGILWLVARLQRSGLQQNKTRLESARAGSHWQPLAL